MLVLAVQKVLVKPNTLELQGQVKLQNFVTVCFVWW